MLVVISNENKINNEAQLINNLFKNGLDFLHLRKPNSTLEEVKELLVAIQPIFYPKIALHQYHFMAEEYHIKRIHLKSNERNLYENFSKENYTLSCSIHSIDEFNLLPENIFDYCFLSPVFNSISKPNYLAKKNNFTTKNNTNKTKIIALGGINYKNCTEGLLRNYDGLALLGGVWNNNPIDSYLKIKTLTHHFFVT